MKKPIGWILLAGGVLIIVLGLWYSFGIFTAKRPVPVIFETPFLQETSTEEAGVEGDFQTQMQQGMQQTIKEQLGNMLPSDFLPKLFNLIAWSVFMGILVFAAGKIAVLGVSLLKA